MVSIEANNRNNAKAGPTGGALAAALRAAGAGSSRFPENQGEILGIELLEQYIAAITDGSIPACNHIRLAVDRHLRDLERAADDEWPYRFDPLLADRAIRWFPLHIRHSIGSDAGKPFHLEPWQAFLTGMMFGWVQKSDGCRRFRKLLLTIARKNGKSTWISAVCMLLATDDINPHTLDIERVANIVLCATKLEQSEQVIFAECVRMREQSESINSRSKLNKTRKTISFTETDSTIRPISSDRAFSGLNPQAVCVDEYHEFGTAEKHREFIDTQITSQGNRAQPWYLVTTTAGTDRSLLYNELYDYCAGILRGEIIDDRQLCLLYELDALDDPYDRKNWIKANPNLGISVRPEFLEQMLTEARDGGFVAANRYLRFHCNRTVTATDRAFDIDQWNAAAGELSDWSDADAIGGGIDLGGRDDFASFALCARFHMGTNQGEALYRYEMRSWTFISDECPRNLNQQPFASWVADGHLMVSDTPVTDLQSELVRACFRWNVADVGFDPAQAQATAEFLIANGIECGRMSQRPYMFHEPITDMLANLAAGRLKHDGNPVLAWAAGNAILVMDRSQQVMYDKRSSREKIDPIVAATMAYRRAMVAPAVNRDMSMNDDQPGRAITLDSAVQAYAEAIFNDL